MRIIQCLYKLALNLILGVYSKNQKWQETSWTEKSASNRFVYLSLAGVSRSHHTLRSGLELAADIASATLTSAKNGSTEIDFSPGSLKIPGNFVADSVTAGATTLLLQIAFPLLLFSSSPLPSTLTLKGGTNAAQAPQIDYVENVFLPFVRRHFGIMAELQVNRRGYFPKGGGEVVATVTPSAQSLQSCSLLDRGEIRCIKGMDRVFHDKNT